MSSASPPVERGWRCAACGARNGPGSDWCTLCLAPLRAPEEPRPASRPAASRPEPEPAFDPPPEPVPAAALPHPRTEDARARAEQQAERLLAELAAAEALPDDGRLAAFHRAGPTAAMMFSLVGGIAACLLLIVLMALFGFLL